MLKLLYVDDEPDILELVKMSLELNGVFEVTNCTSGEDAINRVRNLIPDILLLDVVMPGLSGPETLNKLREIRGLGDLPVIFLTAHVSGESRAELLGLGAKDVLTKPFDPMTLGAQINKALQQ